MGREYDGDTPTKAYYWWRRILSLVFQLLIAAPVTNAFEGVSGRIPFFPLAEVNAYIPFISFLLLIGVNRSQQEKKDESMEEKETLPPQAFHCAAISFSFLQLYWPPSKAYGECRVDRVQQRTFQPVNGSRATSVFLSYLLLLCCTRLPLTGRKEYGTRLTLLFHVESPILCLCLYYYNTNKVWATPDFLSEQRRIFPTLFFILFSSILHNSVEGGASIPAG